MQPNELSANSSHQHAAGADTTAASGKISDQYVWILNEGLLRDEGTLFGIAGVDVQDKLEAIRQYYHIKMAPFAQKKKMLDQMREGLEIERTRLKDTIQAFEGSKHHLTNDNNRETNLFPLIFQLLAYAAMCYCGYLFTDYWLQNAGYETVVGIAVYCFGLFSLFAGRSILYHSSHSSFIDGKETGRERWKIYLEEFGVAAVVSLFIGVLTYKYYGIAVSIVGFLLFFLFFVFAGKGLINNLYKCQVEFKIIRERIRVGWSAWMKRRRLAIKLRRLEKSIQKISIAAEGPETELLKLEAEQESKIRLFMSEYNLAAQGRTGLTVTQLKKFA
jgi:hypothetical protein